MSFKTIFERFFRVYKQDSHLIIKILGVKMTFKNSLINPLEDFCSIPNLALLQEKNIRFPHPLGIVINKNVIIGENCTVYQNVTIGDGKQNPETGRTSPIIGDNVMIYANSVVIGGISIGNNVVIGAGSVVLNDIEDNCVVAGNPARVIKKLG